MDSRISSVPSRLFSTQRFIYLSQIFCKKILWILTVFIGITIISFAVIHLAPGSPTDLETTMNPQADAEARERLEKFYGLDQPLHVQYISWLSRLVHLDFGNSMSSDARPVLDIICEALPVTLWLNITSLVLTLLLAIPIGVFAAKYRGKLWDKISTLIVFVGFAMPSFWLALLLILYFSIDLQWFPISGLKSFTYDSLSTWGKITDIAHHLALPLFISVFGSLAGMSRYMRSSILEILQQDFILAARAKGLPERIVLFRHALGNAMLPMITLLGLSIPGLIGGSVIIESIFSLPGMGQLFYKAVMSRDYSLIMGNLVLGAGLTLMGNIIADICYGLADPRIRTGMAQQGQ